MKKNTGFVHKIVDFVEASLEVFGNFDVIEVEIVLVLDEVENYYLDSRLFDGLQIFHDYHYHT